MAFALLFILAFLIGLAIYSYNRQWIVAVLVPMALFLITTLADIAAQDAWAFSLVFGLPIVFFASLLGAYVVQIRSDDPSDEAENQSTEPD